jgi:hypothetical protein
VGAVNWEEARELAATIRSYEVWLASPEGREAMAPFERIARLEVVNAKLRKKLEKRRKRMADIAPPRDPR